MAHSRSTASFESVTVIGFLAQMLSLKYLYEKAYIGIGSGVWKVIFESPCEFHLIFIKVCSYIMVIVYKCLVLLKINNQNFPERVVKEILAVHSNNWYQ